MLLMIDNYDSFTYNLVQYLGELGQRVEVARNDALDVAAVRRMKPDGVVISPGPCTPNEAGVSMALVRELGDEVPMLGVCLGHQSIAQACGGVVRRARRVMHGKLSTLRHDGRGVFEGLPSSFEVVRYHSLVVDDLPECLEVSAWTENASGERDEIMGLRHRRRPLEGVQFHPESIETEHGHAMLKNFLNLLRR